MNNECALPELYLDLDKRRKLVFSLRGMCLLEDYLQKERGNGSLFTAIDWTHLTVKEISLLLWAGLVGDDEALSLEDASKLITLPHVVSNMNQIVEYITQMLDRALKVIEDPSLVQNLAMLQKKILETGGAIGSLMERTGLSSTESE